MAEEKKDFPKLTLTDYDKKFIIPGCLAIFSLAYYYEIYSFSIDIIKNYIYVENNDLQSNIITILMSIFSSLFTFISIIFLYYNFTNKASVDKLVELLLKIEEFCYTYRNIEFKKQHKIFKKPNSIPQYKTPESVIKSYYGQYSLELKKHNNNQLFFKKLIKINYIVSIVAILIIFYALCVIKFFSLSIIFLTVIVSVLLKFNSSLASETANFNKELEKFPSTEILLTPTETLDEYCTTNFCIDRNLPLKLFHACTTLAVCPFSEISNNITNVSYLNNTTNYLTIYCIFPFNISYLIIYYQRDIDNDTMFKLTFKTKSALFTNDRYKLYFLPNFPVHDAYTKYQRHEKQNEKTSQIGLSFNENPSENDMLVYEYNNKFSTEKYFYFLPTQDYILEGYTPDTITENYISM